MLETTTYHPMDITEDVITIIPHHMTQDLIHVCQIVVLLSQVDQLLCPLVFLVNLHHQIKVEVHLMVGVEVHLIKEMALGVGEVVMVEVSVEVVVMASQMLQCDNL